MKAYGKIRTSGFIKDAEAPPCHCCNGKYCKVKGPNNDNATRGLKKRARQKAKKEIECQMK